MNHYIKGAISGMFGLLLSHPIDTIKTLVQTGVKINYSQLNIKILYKGVKAPLLGVGFEKALVFGTYNYCNKYFTTHSYTNSQSKSFYSVPISGAIAGLTASLVVTPYERYKILQQSSQKIGKVSLGNLYKGLSATFTREVPGFAIYFSVYESLKYHTFTKYNERNIPYMYSFLYGGLSGITAWIFIYPQDRIKTIIQSRQSNQSFISICKMIYKNGGGSITSFYSGFTWAVMRAMLLHSGTFCMMEILNDNMPDYLDI